MIVYVLVALCVNKVNFQTYVSPSVLVFRTAELCIKNAEANRKMMLANCNEILDIQCKERNIDK
jgi:hypothetical protein